MTYPKWPYREQQQVDPMNSDDQHYERLAAWQLDKMRREDAQEMERTAFRAWWDAYKIALGREPPVAACRATADEAEKEYRERLKRHQATIDNIWEGFPEEPKLPVTR